MLDPCREPDLRDAVFVGHSVAVVIGVPADSLDGNHLGWSAATADQR
ncbi:hypothetical protein [Saccharothrix sp. HUAS TT1]